MILSNWKDTYGEWHDACIIEESDIDIFRRGLFAHSVDNLMRVIRIGVPVNPNALLYAFPEENSTVNMMIGMLKGRYRNLKETFFQSNCTINAIDGNNQYYFRKTESTEEPAREAPAESKEAPAELESEYDIIDYRALLSTRAMLKAIGDVYYDGLEFKFQSNRHPSPARAYILPLAKEYMMQVIIPNALIAKKFRKRIDPVAVKRAIHHCMTCGKSESSIAAWKELARDHAAEILDKYWFYVLDMNRDGSEVPSDRRCYLEKFVDTRNAGTKSVYAGERKQFRKSKNQDAVQELLNRMEAEPELRAASHRRLMELGISGRTARLFMKARILK